MLTSQWVIRPQKPGRGSPVFRFLSRPSPETDYSSLPPDLWPKVDCPVLVCGMHEAVVRQTAIPKHVIGLAVLSLLGILPALVPR